jgi:hypothetical protein
MEPTTYCSKHTAPTCPIDGTTFYKHPEYNVCPLTHPGHPGQVKLIK